VLGPDLVSSKGPQVLAGHSHDCLREQANFLKRAHEKNDTNTLYMVANELHSALSKHIREEECVNGWFAEAVRMEPKLSKAISHLKGEHVELLKTLQEITRCSDDDLALLRAHVHRFLSLFRKHEAHEGKIIDHVFYEDLGGPS